MAELFGVATGALSAAGFAGQLAQSASLLHGFINDIKNSPKTVRLISQELSILTSILLEIQKLYNTNDGDLQTSLQHCGKRLDEFLIVIKEIDPTHYPQRRKRMWSQCKVALKRQDLVKCLAELDRCKLMLVQACNNMSRTEQMFQTSQIASILQQTQESAAKEDSRAAASGAAQATIQEIRQILSSLQSMTENIAVNAYENRTKMDETSIGMIRILDNTEVIRTMTKRIESAVRTAKGIESVQQTFIDDTLQDRTTSFQSLKKRIDQSIAMSIEKHLKGHFQPRSVTQKGQPIIIKDSVDPQHNSSTANPDIGLVQHPSHDQNLIRSRPVIAQISCGWIKTSSSETQQRIMQNRMLGTLHIRTTTVTLTREGQGGDFEIRQVTTSVIFYLPPSWATSRGAILHRQYTPTGCTGSQSTLHWSLSSVHIVPDDAEIIEVCYSHDLERLKELFDNGLATPYDVDRSGRTLIGFIAVGLMIHEYESRHETLRHRLDDMNAILELLLANGIDSGCMDIQGFNSVAMAAFSWYDASRHSPQVTSKDDENINFVLKKLLKHAKTDPFSGPEVLFTVVPYAGLEMLKFPAEICYPDLDYNISPHQLDLLMDQSDWRLSWDSNQLETLCSPFSHELSRGVAEVRHNIAFWVTSQAEDVRLYLYTKLDLIRKLINHDQLDIRGKHSTLRALHVTIHHGGEVIALLTRHLHCDCFPSLQPRIRHGFKKLVVLERWLTQLFHLLLNKSPARDLNTAVLDELGRHAQIHNARTLCAWTKALKAWAHGHTQDIASQPDIEDTLCYAELAEEEPSHGTETSSEWESEHSEKDEDLAWQTEEDSEDEEASQSVNDKYATNAINLDLEHHSGHACDHHLYEYDEDYWVHLYPCLERPNPDTARKEDRKGLAQTLGAYTRDFLAALI